jgi:hypothetical protein
MKTKLSAIVLLFLAGGLIFFLGSIFAADATTDSVSGTNAASPFKITVTPRKTHVQVGESFVVGLEVKNVSSTNQSFKVWSCSWYENWVSSNPVVQIKSWACTENCPIEIKLAPGESFKEELNGEEAKMEIVQSVSTNKVFFRMHFMPLILGDAKVYNPDGKSFRTFRTEIPDFKAPFWSDEVGITIDPK